MWREASIHCTPALCGMLSNLVKVDPGFERKWVLKSEGWGEGLK